MSEPAGESVEVREGPETPSPVPVFARTGFRPGVLAAIVFGLALLSAYVGTVMPIYGTQIKAYYGIGEGRLGLILSVGYLASMAACLAAGPLVAKFGARRVLRASAGLLAVAGLLIAAGGGWWSAMLLAVALNAASYNVLYVVSQVYLAELFPNHRRGVLSALTAALSVGGIVFPIVAQRLLDWQAASESVGFAEVLRAPPVVIALGMVIGAVVLHRRTFDTRGSTPAAPLWRSFRISGGSVPWLTATVLLIGSDAMVSTRLPLVLDEPTFRAQLGWLKSSYVYSAFLMAYLVTRTLLAAVPEGFGRRTLLALPALTGGAIFLYGVASGRAWTLVGSLLVGTLIWALQMPTLLATLADRERERFPVILSLQIVLGSLLGFVGVNVMGWWSKQLDEASRWQTMLIPAGLITLAGCVALGASLARGSRIGMAMVALILSGKPRP